MKLVKSYKALALTVGLIMAATFVNGASRYSVAIGNWNATSTWSTTSGGAPGASVPVAGDAVIIEKGFNVTVTADAACTTVAFTTATSTSLSINSGITLTVSGGISMPRPVSSAPMAINVGAGILNCSSITLGGTSFTSSRSTTITVSTGTVNVSGNITSAGTYSYFTFTGAGTLNAGGTFMSGSQGTFTASTGTVNFNGGAQTIAPFLYTFNNVTLSNSGVKTTSNATINGILSMEGTATASTYPTYGGSATLRYNTATSRTAGPEWRSTTSATGGIIIANSGVITTGAAKTLNSNVPLTINAGATLSTGSNNSWTLTVGGTTSVSGTLTLANTRTKTFTGDVTVYSGGVWNETGVAAVSFAGSLTNNASTFTALSGVHTFSGTSKTIGGSTATAIPSVLISGTLTNNGTLTVSTTLAGTGTLTNGTTGILNFGGSSISPTLAASAASNTINYSGAAQTVKPTTYSNLTLSGSGIKTTTSVTVNGILSMEGTTASVSAVPTYGGSATLQYKGSAAQTTGAEFPATWAGSGGVKIENASGVTLNAVRNIGANPFAIGSNVAGSIFNDGGYQLTATGTLNLTSGIFKLGAAAATTFPAFGTRNISDGTTVEYAATATQSVKGITYSNLTISGTGSNSKKADADITVNGILNLSSANASAIQGCLEMTISYTDYPGTTISNYLNSYILYMGEFSSITGNGDVTGTVKRIHTLVANTPYQFGHQYTTVSLTTGTMPTALAVTITIGTTPGNSTPADDKIRDAIRRTYEIIPTGGSNCFVTANFHYLDSELTSSITSFVNSESKLTTMDYDIDTGGHGAPYSDEHGRANYDFTNNYIGLSSVPISYFIQIPTTHEWRTIFTLRNYGEAYYTWNGSSNTTWGTAANWTLSSGGSGIPNVLSHVIIPDAATTPNDPALPTGNTTINTISIENGGILTMGSNTLTIQNSFSGGWEDQNPSGNDPGTSTVVFTRPNTTIAGSTRFYNVEIKAFNNINDTIADITNQAGSSMKIAGSITRTGGLGTGKWYADVFGATIEYSGGSQTVLLPDGTPHYHNLILSGSGTKTMPSSAMTLHGDFTLSGTVSATAAAALTIGGSVTIGSGTTFNASSYTHTVSGNWTNNSGTYTTGSSTINFDNSTASQTINGTAASQTFNAISVNKTSQVLNIAGSTTTLILNSSLTITSGTFTAGTATNINVAGNWSNSGTYSAGSGTVTLNGSAAQSISGSSSFNNLTVDNAAGVTAGDNQTVNGILCLNSANASSTQGCLQMTNPYALIMGASATTTGTGDVTGIVTRNSFVLNTPYSFGNQYSTMNFTEAPLPTAVSFKIVLTAEEPAWMTTTTGIYRYYDIISNGDNTASRVTLNLHYLDSELHGATENNLDLFDNHDGFVHDHGRSNNNTTQNWVGLANLGLIFVAPTTFDSKYWTLGTNNTGNVCTWIGGSVAGRTEWTLPGNWDGGVPVSISHVIIPDVIYDPLFINTTVGSVSIQSGGVLGVSNTTNTLYISGGAGAWENLAGTDGFIPSASTVKFTNADASMSGQTNFVNVTVADGATLTLGTDNYLGIGGTLSLSSTGILNAANNHNTVEYNGGSDQTIINPNGSTPGYHNLTLSGDMTKNLPETSLQILGDFTLSGTAKTNTTTADITVGGALSIENMNDLSPSLTIGAGKTLSVAGITTLSSAECLVLLSDFTGTASFIDNGTININGQGSSRIERYLTPYIVQDPTDWRYHFLSSPVVDQPIEDEFVLLPNTTDDFYSWSEPTNMWINTKADGDPPYTWNSAFESNFIQGKGYLVAYPDAVSKIFIGTPFTSAAGLTMTCTNTSGGGWNLLGNPFPSAIDWDAVAKGSGMDEALYYYENDIPRYRYYVELSGGIGTAYSGGSRYIPAMQGFMVHAKSSGTKTITMDNGDRVHESLTTYYKDAPLINNVLNIWVEGNNSRDDARVCYYERASVNFDGEYDAYKLFSYNNTIPELYSVTPDNTQLAINTLPLADLYSDVPVGFMPGTPGNFTISAGGINSFSDATYIFLKDLKTGTIQKLNDNPSYSFIATAGDITNRFVLHFQDATSISNPDGIKDFTIYQENGFIIVLHDGTHNGHVIVNDLAGRRIALANLAVSSPTRIQVQGSGVYIVSIISITGVSNYKIFMK